MEYKITPLNKLNVLVADDSPTIRTACRKMLTKLGIGSLKEADSIDLAWRIILESHSSNSPIDVILCDWIMPNGNGIDLLKKIRSHENTEIRLTKFIMVTGANDKTILAMDAGAHNVIHKPFTEETIREKFELVFGKLAA